MKLSIKATKLQHAQDLALPAYATSQSAGMDLLAAVFEPTVVKSGEIAIRPSLP